jgi:hypothetical protein
MRLRFILVALAALSLSACIDSAAPILTDAQPLLGQTFNLQFYGLRKGAAHDPLQARYVWNGKQYAHAGGAMDDVKAFTVHTFEGNDLIAQSVPDERQTTTDYGLLRRLADGVFLLVPVDEDDADEATRTKYCQHADKAACRVSTREQLFALARATAARKHDSGGLVIRLADDEGK